jgi:hypothetical protein
LVFQVTPVYKKVFKISHIGRLHAMTKGRDNGADSLSDLLELVRTRRQSGSLSVERYHAGRFEEGEIYFQGGQPTYAHTGQLSGQEALSWMLSWRQVYFNFNVEEPRAPAPISSNVSNAVAAKAQSSPLSTQLPQVNTNASTPSTSSRPPQVNVGIREVARSAGESDNTNRANDLHASPATPGVEWLVPQKLGGERDVLSLPLTRPQRSIYLLIDGRRTISDLTRCTRKSVQEIERLLTELREQGLISI